MPQPARSNTLTQKVSRDTTGLNGSIFIHIDHLDGVIDAVRYSAKWKDNKTMDTLLLALSDATTDMVRSLKDDKEVRHEPFPPFHPR